MNKPNILFLMCDQLRGDVIAPEHPCLTPNIDKISNQGVRFQSAYTPNAICSPARASLMTGLLPHNHGVTTVTHTVDDDQSCLREDKPHWAQRLVKAGYSTGYFGKWHIERSNQLDKFGWQVNGSYEQEDVQAIINQKQLRKFDKSILAKYNTNPPGYNKDSLLYGVTEKPPEERMLGLATDMALEFLDDVMKQDDPWCCFVSLTEPHDPFVCGKEAFDKYDVNEIELPLNTYDDLEGRPNVYRLAAQVWADMTEQERKEAIVCYYASVTEIDQQFGRVIDKVKENGHIDDTLIILTSDHGEFLGAHGLYCKNFHAGEEVYNIPLIMAGPNIPESVVTNARVGTHDLCPTLLELVGCQTIDVVDSQSFVKLLQDPCCEEDFQQGYAEYFGGRLIITQRIVWDGPWKLVFNGFDYSELYDLKDDPYEMNNLIHKPQYDSIVKKMFAHLWQKLRDTDDHSVYKSQYPILRIAPYGPEILNEDL